MKLFTAWQMQHWDAYTIKHQQISSLELMERASQACTDWIIQQNFANRNIKIFCGKGNNGGDGLAIARQLLTNGTGAVVYIAAFGATGTPDFQQNLARLRSLTTDIHYLQSAEQFPAINEEDIVIDALFGFGLNRPLTGLYQQLVEHINNYAKQVIAIDVPSGLFTDETSNNNTIIKATYTLTFQSLKLCFVAAENAAYFGEVIVLPIGLENKYEDDETAIYEMVSEEMIVNLYKPRKAFSHKGTYGHALLIAGNTGKMGAAVMCAKACLRSGVGLLTCAIPREEFAVLQTTTAEAMVINRKEIPDISKYDAIGIGPGLGTADEMITLLLNVVERYKQPMLLDADALNIIARHTDLLQLLPKHAIITPHPKEFDRLFGESSNDFERMQKAIDASVQYNIIIVLKGHYTLIANEGKGYFNTTGNAGMATGGSGDILSGIITALLAQQYSPFGAAILGVYVHGLAGDWCLEEQSYESLLPTDMVEKLGKAFKQISNKKEA
ncbi:NAD(P)H-hydrate dehydratase [Ilyomonas limi]|uniref:Bifunctional NAD(P)H-hydrate repair enzyme n=1 Tax=Ilyomonas limi TaxID=2575867 RepID=A0A4U3L1R4_9BACT|nr:NAD(P)H-hydrate dehydratase [Ilyomonas limi]TKK67387.1 NAD(P)H-hydrate dehydratase [Ilyomonas limi]